MTEKKEVTNEMVLRTLSNTDNYRIIQSVLKSFANQMDDDTLTACGDDAVVKVLSYWDENKPGGIKLTTALRRETYRVCINAWDLIKRSRRRQEISEAREARRHAETKTWSRAAESCEAKEQVLSIMDSLAEGYQQIIQLHFFEYLTIREISERLSLSVESCRRRLNDALRVAKFLAESAA